MREKILLALYWIGFRVPRLWMNRTAYAFWIKEERRKLQAIINRR